MAVTKRKKAIFFCAACLMQFVSNFVGSLQGVLLSDYIDFYHLESAAQGLMSTFQYAGCTLACILTLFIAGRIPRHKLLICSGFLCSIPMFLIGLKPSYAVVLLMYALIGMGFATNSSVVSSIAGSLYPNSRPAMGIVHSFFGAGGLVCPIFMRALLNDFPWNVTCMFNAFVAFLLFILYACCIPISKDVINELNTETEPIHMKDLKQNFSKLENILLLIGVFGYQGFQNGISVWISRFSENCTTPTGLGALSLSAFWLGNLTSRLTATRIKIRTEILFSVGLIGGVIMLLIGVFSGDSRVLLVCIIVAGITSGACTPFGYNMFADNFTGNKLLPPTICGMTMFVSVSVTTPLTAAVATGGLIKGMISVAVYGTISIIAVVLILVRERIKK